MCLSIAIRRPDDVLATGIHAGHEWAVVNNGRAIRCGYVKVEPGHPWYGKDDGTIYDDESNGHRPEVHGGITFAGPDVHCGKGGPDDGWWIGFDCNHAGDAPDPTLPGYDARYDDLFPRGGPFPYEVRTQAYVEAECRSLCEQAAACTSVPL